MTTKKGPTLADMVIRTMYAARSKDSNYFLDHVARARKFVLDESMSRMMADLGWAAYKGTSIPQRVQRMDDIRRLARLPHPLTWVEWDERALARRARAEYGSDLDPTKTPILSGGLFEQHPQVDTAFKYTSFGLGQNFPSEGEVGETPVIGMTPFAIMWRTDDGPLPWNVDATAADMASRRRMPLATMMTGILDYDGPISIAAGPYGEHVPATRMRQLFAEQFGMMRYILGLLATINDLPVKIETVRPSKGFVARGRYRKFMEHSVITLTVPETRYRVLARKVASNLRRRAHQVRGHWREHWRNPLTPTCEHRFENASPTLLRCSKCKGEKMWIPEHQRGDASIGFVTHDYKVTTEGAGEHQGAKTDWVDGLDPAGRRN